MAKVVESITPELQAFIEAQPLFFVASAPLSGEGHVNLSPKGLDALLRWAESKADELPAYRAKKNARSIDGLPAPGIEA